jgi:hypothetical protein
MDLAKLQDAPCKTPRERLTTPPEDPIVGDGERTRASLRRGGRRPRCQASVAPV